MVGAGFIGGAVSREFEAAGWAVDAVSRRVGERLDVATATGRAALVELVRAGGFDLVVLCHGPSDVTWCEENPSVAAAAHAGTADAVAGTGAPVLLISTDNVFPGQRERYGAADPVAPCNVYGTVKRDAELAVLAAGGRVVRVSLVYGWSSGDERPNFAERCLADLRAGRVVRAPYDQVMTPIHVGDVARAVVGCVAGQADAPIVHLAGPSAVSRADFARLAAAAVGAPPELVVPVPRAETHLACRPPFSGLEPGPFLPSSELARLRPLDPARGLAAMVAAPRMERLP
jgi:dTDP-4-dehydrorhamnose reductase